VVTPNIVSPVVVVTPTITPTPIVTFVPPIHVVIPHLPKTGLSPEETDIPWSITILSSILVCISISYILVQKRRTR
jgi:hypothetical protein